MRRVVRWCVYCLGMAVLALGITLNTKAGLGVSPIISVAYSVSELWGLNFGDMTFALYAMFVLAQLFLRRREEWGATLLQLVVSLLFSRLLNLFAAVIGYDCTRHGLWLNLLVLALAVFLTGLGIAMTVDMRLVPNPGDGIVQAIAQRAGWSQGFCKNVFDLGCVCTTLLVGFACARPLLGIGVGTLAAMLGVGRSVALVNHFGKEKMCAVAGVEAPAT